MRPGVPGNLQLNPFKVRLASMYAGKYGKPPKIAGLYPGVKMPMAGGMGGGGMGMPGGGRMMGGGMGPGLPKLDLRGGLR